MIHVFACLVHERADAVADLVDRLRAADPESVVLLYDGGRDPRLLDAWRGGADPAVHVHPTPSPQVHGALHGFGIDAMRYGLRSLGADAMTIVDSDQLPAGRGHGARLAAHLDGRPRVGVTSPAPGRHPPDTHRYTPRQAYAELPLWRDVLRRHPGGEGAFPHWTFWPATVFTRAGMEAVVGLVDGDPEVARLLATTRMWAPEEVLLPTLVALAGLEVARGPFDDRLVRYRRPPTVAEAEAGLADPDVMWIHPVARDPADPVRRRIRALMPPVSAPEGETVPDAPAPRPVRLLPILERMRTVEGWFSDAEADLLAASLVTALCAEPGPHRVVEVGSYHGRSTVVLASVVAAVSPRSRVYAVDPHAGEVGVADAPQRTAPTLASFRATIARFGLGHVTDAVVSRADQTRWDGPVTFLLIDGLHDHPSVRTDTLHFAPWLWPGALVAFHDYAPYYPGVVRWVDELCASGAAEVVDRADSLVVVRWRRVPDAMPAPDPAAAPARGARPAPPAPGPVRVSCLMPTRDRPWFARRAVDHFLAQGLPGAELVVVDDGDEPLDGLPDDPRVRVIRLAGVRSLGEKRNLACDAARGEILVHWDDDDWYGPGRLAAQVACLERGDADACGLDRLLYLDTEMRAAWRYTYPRAARPWISDGTLAYRRGLWDRNPFPERNGGLDVAFLWSRPGVRMCVMDDDSWYVATMHPGNTSPKDTRHRVWTPCGLDEVAARMGEGEMAAYLGRGAALTAPGQVP